jgi:hypothetical protein
MQILKVAAVAPGKVSVLLELGELSWRILEYRQLILPIPANETSVYQTKYDAFCSHKRYKFAGSQFAQSFSRTTLLRVAASGWQFQFWKVRLSIPCKA